MPGEASLLSHPDDRESIRANLLCEAYGQAITSFRSYNHYRPAPAVGHPGKRVAVAQFVAF